MRKFLYVFIFSSLSSLYSQEKKFELNGGADLGFSKLEIDNNTINATSTGAYLSIQYSISKSLNLESGLGWMKVQGDYNASGESYFIENQLLSIPIGLNTTLNLLKEANETKQPISILIGGGLYTNYLIKSEIENISKDSNLGWNFGGYGRFGIHLQASDEFCIGIGMKGQYDFSEIEKNNLKFKQNRNVLYIDFGIKL